MTPTDWDHVEQAVRALEASLDAIREQVTRLKHQVRRQGRLPVEREAEARPVWRCPHVERCSHQTMCAIATSWKRPEREVTK